MTGTITRSGTEPLPQLKPKPTPSALSAPHWEAAAAGKLLVQQCSQCAHHEFPPQALCSQCFGDQLEWVVSSGIGEIYSHSTVHRPQTSAFESPYVVVIVQLSEGWHMLGNLIGATEAYIGLPVTVCFEARDGITLPQFTALKKE